jgi:hypothetical protein
VTAIAPMNSVLTRGKEAAGRCIAIFVRCDGDCPGWTPENGQFWVRLIKTLFNTCQNCPILCGLACPRSRL